MRCWLASARVDPPMNAPRLLVYREPFIAKCRWVALSLLHAPVHLMLHLLPILALGLASLERFRKGVPQAPPSLAKFAVYTLTGVAITASVLFVRCRPLELWLFDDEISLPPPDGTFARQRIAYWKLKGYTVIHDLTLGVRVLQLLDSSNDEAARILLSGDVRTDDLLDLLRSKGVVSIDPDEPVTRRRGGAW